MHWLLLVRAFSLETRINGKRWIQIKWIKIRIVRRYDTSRINHTKEGLGTKGEVGNNSKGWTDYVHFYLGTIKFKMCTKRIEIWRWLVTTRRLYFRGNSCRYPTCRTLGGPPKRSEGCGREKKLLPLSPKQYRFFGHPVPVQSLYRLRWIWSSPGDVYKGHGFGVVAPRSAETTQRFAETYRFYLQLAAYFCWFLTWFTLRFWRRSRYVPPNRRIPFEIHCVITH